jgi:hypothetical protein
MSLGAVAEVGRGETEADEDGATVESRFSISINPTTGLKTKGRSVPIELDLFSTVSCLARFLFHQMIQTKRMIRAITALEIMPAIMPMCDLWSRPLP